MEVPRARQSFVSSARSKSLPDTGQLEVMTQFFFGSLEGGRSCSLQDARALREAYSSSECDSTSSSSSSSESLSTSSSSSGSGSDSTSTDDEDDSDDEEAASAACGNLLMADFLLPVGTSSTSLMPATATTMTPEALAATTASTCGWRPLSALREQRESASTPASSADFSFSSSSSASASVNGDGDDEADVDAAPPDAFADAPSDTTTPSRVVVTPACQLRLQQY